MQTIIQKLDYFTSATRIAENQIKFIVDGKPIYVLWGAGEPPAELAGKMVAVTDVCGKEYPSLVPSRQQDDHLNL